MPKFLAQLNRRAVGLRSQAPVPSSARGLRATKAQPAAGDRCAEPAIDVPIRLRRHDLLVTGSPSAQAAEGDPGDVAQAREGTESGARQLVRVRHKLATDLRRVDVGGTFELYVPAAQLLRSLADQVRLEADREAEATDVVVGDLVEGVDETGLGGVLPRQLEPVEHEVCRRPSVVP